MPSLLKSSSTRGAVGTESQLNQKLFLRRKKKNLAKTSAASLFADGDIADRYTDVSKT